MGVRIGYGWDSESSRKKGERDHVASSSGNLNSGPRSIELTTSEFPLFNATNLPPTFSHLPQHRATKIHPINYFILEETWLHIPTLSLILRQTHTLTPTIQIQVQVQVHVREVDRQSRVLFSNYTVRINQILAQCPRQ